MDERAPIDRDAGQVPAEAAEIRHGRYRAWLALADEPGEALTTAERHALDEHLETCSACRVERAELVRLDQLLATERVPVEAAFTARVMESLPPAGWEGRSARSWSLPVAAAVVFAAAAAFLVSGTGGSAGASALGAFSALAQLFAAGALAGSGLLWASWQGLGLVLDQVLSVSTAIAFAVLVVSLYVLLLSMISRQRRRTVEAVEHAGRLRDHRSRERGD